jgi:glycerol-3-phosphate acyltransferase PlsX
MGGDFAPRNNVAGAFEALRDAHDRVEIIFVGRETIIKEALNEFPAAGANSGYSIVDAPDIIDMHDEGAASVRKKKNSSIAIGLNLQKEGKADAFLSAGHTGAVMSATTLILGRIEGVARPTIGTFFPTERGVCLLLDAGANVDCKPQHLYEFGVMGSIYVHQMLGLESPTVGLLNVGEEESKGTEAVREAFALFKSGKVNFIGNVEGRDILQGGADVIVCDGFTGNVILKFGESVPGFMKNVIGKHVRKNPLAMLLSGFIRGTLRSALKSMDYEEFGGVPILGVNGTSMIGHGKSTPKAIRNMILAAESMVKKNINGRIREALAT